MIYIGDETVWFGLYSRSTGGTWRFLNGDDSTADSIYKCIDFWKYQLKASTNHRPRCIGDRNGGSQSANFDGYELIVDIDGDEALTFLVVHVKQ